MTEYRTLLSNVVKKSQTNGLLKNDGTVDTTNYLSTHQDITGKEDKSNKVTTISSSSTDTQYPSAKAVKSNLDLKVNKQEDSLITVTNGNIILSEYHTKNRWTNNGASGGGITSTQLTSGSQGNAFYTYNFPSSVTSVTINFLSNTTNAYITNGEGGNGISIDNSPIYTATSDEGLGIRIDDGNKEVTYTVTSITFNMNNWIDKIYPIGATYISTVEIEPSTLFGGVWERIKDRFLLSSGDTYVNATTGGSADAVVVSHNHTQASHTHTTSRHYVGISDSVNWAYASTRQAASSGSTYFPYSDKNTDGITESNTMTTVTPTINSQGVSGTGKNMPPYLVVYMWKRIA